MGGVDVGIPGSIGKGGMGVGNWGGLNLNLGSLNVIGNRKMLGIGSMIFFKKNKKITRFFGASLEFYFATSSVEA
jgi:hypothetical protein